MDDCAERQPVSEGGRQVGDAHVPVARRDVLAPLQQALQSRLPRHDPPQLLLCARENKIMSDDIVT